MGLFLVIIFPSALGGQLLNKRGGGESDVLVIGYHDITVREEGDRFQIPLRYFEAQMEYLAANGWSSVTPDDVQGRSEMDLSGLAP
jgi:hypothetical protein